MAFTFSYYVLFGVPVASDVDVVKKAWRALARELHPDKNPDPGAAAKFAAASEAWTALSDPSKKAMYDVFGDLAVELGFDPSLLAARSRATPRPTPRPRPPDPDVGPAPFPFGWDGSGMSTESDPRASTVRPRRAPSTPPRPPSGRPPVPRRGADLRVDAFVPLKVAALGGPWIVPVDRPSACASCEGTGWRLAGRACPKCQGTGNVVDGVQVELRIPPDSHDGRQVKVSGAGAAGKDGGEPGDLWATVRVVPEPGFVRHGLDLLTEVRVPADVLAKGGTIDVENLHETVRVDVPANTTSGKILRVKGRGVPGPAGRLPGDLHVRVVAGG